MRLLQLQDDDEFQLVEFGGDFIPPYAILSHTWGADHDEVSFEDILTRRYKSKAGYNKLFFCGKQAAKDGLHYSWVDTCCTIQTHHQRQRPTKRVTYAAIFGSTISIAFQYNRITIL